MTIYIKIPFLGDVLYANSRLDYYLTEAPRSRIRGWAPAPVSPSQAIEDPSDENSILNKLGPPDIAVNRDLN